MQSHGQAARSRFPVNDAALPSSRSRFSSVSFVAGHRLNAFTVSTSKCDGVSYRVKIDSFG